MPGPDSLDSAKLDIISPGNVPEAITNARRDMSFRPTAVCVVLLGDCVVMGRPHKEEGHEKDRRYIQLIQGGVDEDEPHDAAERELREEVNGIGMVQVEGPLGAIRYSNGSQRDGYRAGKLLIGYACLLGPDSDPAPKASETDEIRLFSLSEAEAQLRYNAECYPDKIVKVAFSLYIVRLAFASLSHTLPQIPQPSCIPPTSR